MDSTMPSASMESRQNTFSKLKPICVGLTQTTLALNGPRGSIAELTSKLDELERLVASFTSTSNPLDDKLADYIFFPLSQVLKLSRKVSIRCLELTLSVLVVLIDHGWRQKIQPQLATQILILCTLLASDKPSGLASVETTVELRTYALRCLGGTFNAVGASKDSRKLWQSESSMPQIGQTLSTALDALVEGLDLAIQVAATDATKSLIAAIGGKDMLAGFLPGIISKLTKVLSPQTKQRRSHEVLVGCLSMLQRLLLATVSDEAAASVDAATKTPRETTSSSIDAKWFAEAATRLKPALTRIVRLRSHERDDVKLAVGRLCLMILSSCRKTLSTCSDVALETLVVLGADDSIKEIHVELELIVRTEATLATALQELLHEWLQSMPRVMQSADEQAKVKRVQRIRAAYETLQNCDIDLTVIERGMGQALRDSVVITIQAPKNRHDQPARMQTMETLDVELLNRGTEKHDFGSALVQHRGQEEVMNGIEGFVEIIGRSSQSYAFASEMARDLRNSQDDTKLANLWLLYVAAKSAATSANDIDDLLNITGDRRSADLVEEMYSLSLNVLRDSSTQPSDTRLKSLALRALALRAECAGEEFRYELIDALYPMLHTLATPDKLLQNDSIVALNKITKACAYSSTQELVVANVDYLTNAVALKLNAFDVSPQGPQVLLMMVQLAGPSLLPYLEDTVESIFAALEDFHGYPLLVELLFRVLAVMAEEGVKAPQLAITRGTVEEPATQEVKAWLSASMSDLIEHIKSRSEDTRSSEQAHNDADPPGSFPHQPWGDKANEGSNEDDDTPDENDGRVAEEDSTPPPPAPRTYDLLLKITTLTQHYLSSASPSLRISLLGLIRTTVPAIAQHENSFLPLINTLWPEVTARLEDGEVSVQVTALDIITVFCEHAKDFMRSRMLQLWPKLHELHQRVAREVVVSMTPPSARNEQQRSAMVTAKPASAKMAPSFKQAVMRMKAAPADYSNTLTRMLWDAVVRTITAAVQAIPLPPEKFDEALDLLEVCLDDETVSKALEAQNADAVWLVKMRTGQLGDVVMPSASGVYAGRWAAVAG